MNEWHGHNVFFRDGDRVFRTYFINNRGDEAMGTTWSYLDITAARPSGDLGGLAGGLPANPAVQMVELARRLYRRGVARPEMGRGVRRRRSRVPKADGELKARVGDSERGRCGGQEKVHDSVPFGGPSLGLPNRSLRVLGVQSGPFEFHRSIAHDPPDGSSARNRSSTSRQMSTRRTHRYESPIDVVPEREPSARSERLECHRSSLSPH